MMVVSGYLTPANCVMYVTFTGLNSFVSLRSVDEGALVGDKLAVPSRDNV